MPVRALILEGSLKPAKGDSHTFALARMVGAKLAKEKVGSAIVHLASLDLPPGVTAKALSLKDSFPRLARDIEDADCLIFATPIWWGQASSLIQRVIERMTAFDDDYIENGRSRLYGKVFGSIVAGTVDGTQAIIARLNGFAAEIGLTCPPENYVTFQAGNASPAEVARDESAMAMAQVMARNLALWSEALREIRVPKIRRFKTELASKDPGL